MRRPWHRTSHRHIRLIRENLVAFSEIIQRCKLNDRRRIRQQLGKSGDGRALLTYLEDEFWRTGDLPANVKKLEGPSAKCKSIAKRKSILKRNTPLERRLLLKELRRKRMLGYREYESLCETLGEE